MSAWQGFVLPTHEFPSGSNLVLGWASGEATTPKFSCCAGGCRPLHHESILLLSQEILTDQGTMDDPIGASVDYKKPIQSSDSAPADLFRPGCEPGGLSCYVTRADPIDVS